ncbi:S26 family signal peptidase [Nitrospira sp. Kam-Ns4a]
MSTWWRRPWVRGPILTLTAVTWFAVLISPWYQLVIRDDLSWPYHRVFLLDKTRAPQRGDLVAFIMTPELAARVQPPRDRPYARVGKLWGKRLLGLPGDQITVTPLPDGRARIAINGHEVGVTLTRDRFGQDIRPATLVSPIPPGQVYVALPHPRSFDSRYWGYLRADQIVGVEIPLF